MGADEYSDGLFFMEYKDFMRFMTGYDVAYFEEGYKHSSIKLTGDINDPTILEFRIKKKGFYYFSLHQINSRAFKDSASRVISQDYAYSLLTLIIGLRTGTTPRLRFEELGMVKRSHKEVWLKIECEPGDYVAYVDTG